MKVLTTGEGTRKLTAPPVSISCVACRGQFFAASLPIHQKTCFQRNAFVLVPCEKCQGCIRACDFHSHSTSCTGKPLSLDNNAPGFRNNGIKPYSNLVSSAPMDLNFREADGRVRCKTCERAFSQERISKHQSVCHGKPRSLKKTHEPRQRPVIPVRQEKHFRDSTMKQGPRRRIVQRVVASRPREVSFCLCSGQIRSNDTATAQRYLTTTILQLPRGTGDASGGCDTSNASSASNPLVTNSFMTMRR